MQKTINKKKILFISFIIIITTVILDQITKSLVLKKITSLISDTDGMEFFIKVSDFLNIVLVWNSGISFGIFNGLKFMPHILLLINILISSTIFYLICKSNNFIYNIALSFIFGGAVGNIIDRIFRGAVIDFLDFHFRQYHWPAFNLADSSIFIGIIIYLVYDLFYKVSIKND